jgi:uncharacterized protein DUF3485
MVRTALSTAAGVAVVVAAGLVHGFWTGRWQPASALSDAVARLDRVPLALGDWHGQAEELEAVDMKRTGASAWLIRRYDNRLNRATVSVLLVCGRSGPISVHTPDVCYNGAGYEMVGDAVKATVQVGASAAPAELWTARFRKQDAAVPSYLRIFWGWSTPGGPWSAPDNPRVAFARSHALYKLYVIRPMTSPDESLEEDPALPFIRQLLSQFDGPAAPGAPAAPAP